MSAPQQSRPVDITSAEAVVEFGPESTPPRRRWSAGSGVVRGLADDRRAVPLAAAVAAVAAFGSLVSEWQVTTIGRGVFSGTVGERVLRSDLTDLGTLGTGYLVGVFLLVATVVLTLFGPPAVRGVARLTGLSAGGTLLALVAALAVSLDGQSRTVPQLYNVEIDQQQIHLVYGRGLWCAAAAALLAILALHLAGRHPASEQAEPWRRPPVAEEEFDGEPLELTVAPAKPFTMPRGDRDKPSTTGRPGISG